MLAGTTGTACTLKFGTYKKTSIGIACVCMYWEELEDPRRGFSPAIGMGGIMFDIRVPPHEIPSKLFDFTAR